MKWAKNSNDKEWHQRDQDLDKMLEATLTGTAEQKANTLTAITYHLARECFGTEDKKVNIKPAQQPSRRQREIHCLSQEITMLTKQFKRALADEREGTMDLTGQFWEHLCRTLKSRKHSEQEEG